MISVWEAVCAEEWHYQLGAAGTSLDQSTEWTGLSSHGAKDGDWCPTPEGRVGVFVELPSLGV